MIARAGPRFGELNFVIAFDDRTRRVDHNGRVEQLVAVSIRHSDDGMDLALATRVADMLEPGVQCLARELFHVLFIEIAAQGALRKYHDSRTLASTSLNVLFHHSNIVI